MLWNILPRPIHPNPLWELPLQEHKVEYLQSRLSAGDNPLPCRGHLAMSGGIFGCHPWGSNGGNPGMLLNIFNEEDRTPLTPPNPHTTNIQAKMSVVPRSRTLDLQEGTVGWSDLRPVTSYCKHSAGAAGIVLQLWAPVQCTSHLLRPLDLICKEFSRIPGWLVNLLLSK